MDAHTLGTIGSVAQDDEQNSGNFAVRCPRCGYEETGLTRSKACSRSRREGCPDCERPKNERYDLQTKTVTGPYDLTDVGAPLAVSKMD